MGVIKIKLYNYELDSFIDFLYNLKLIDQKSRMKTRFMRILNEKYQLFQEERQQLLKEHSRLDDEGNPQTIMKDGQECYDIVDMNAYNKAYLDLLNEEVIIEQNEERRNMLLSVCESVLFCGLEFEGEDQFKYDRFCEIVEQVDYES